MKCPACSEKLKIFTKENLLKGGERTCPYCSKTYVTKLKMKRVFIVFIPMVLMQTVVDQIFYDTAYLNHLLKGVVIAIGLMSMMQPVSTEGISDE